jgi:signal-transduction protein with cAMP-binding, CBS, and nucleotidyltransferase domain
MFTYTEHQKKMAEIKDIIIKTREIIKEMDEKYPDFQHSFYDKYMKAREEAGIKESKEEAADNFIKFLVEEVDLGF